MLIWLIRMLGFIVALCAGRKLGWKGVSNMTIGLMVGLLALWIGLYKEIIIESTIRREELWNIIDMGGYKINMEFIYDSLTVSMLLPVIFVSLMVHYYSKGYMKGTRHIVRFMGYLSMFTMFMIILVTGGNYIIMFIGWEGVGISSFLLISYWHTRVEAQKSGVLAIIMNRIGDWSLTIGIIMLLLGVGSVDMGIANRILEESSNTTIINVLIIIGCMAKSAQIGLDSWLPEAMEGPTRVSALIHAATMVTAGVYLLVRSSYIIELDWLIIIGGLTGMIGGMKGILEEDIKRVIAYSTTSQLGYMVLSVGLGNNGLAIFHLINHAFFKALLFLGAGSVIHSSNGNQDLRTIEKLNLRITYSAMWIGVAGLSALRFVGGFYSKDIIIEISWEKKWIWIISVIGGFYTALYSSNVISVFNLNKESKEEERELWIPLVILSLMTLVAGYLMKDMLIGLGTDYWDGSQKSFYWIDGEYTGLIEKLLPTLIALIAIGSESTTYWLTLKVWVDIIWRKLARDILEMGYTQTKILDKGILELDIIGRMPAKDQGDISSKSLISSKPDIRDYVIYGVVIAGIYLLLG